MPSKSISNPSLLTMTGNIDGKVNCIENSWHQIQIIALVFTITDSPWFEQTLLRT